MTTRLYKLHHPDQIRVYAADFLRGIATILKDTEVEEKTPDAVLSELAECLGEDEGLWVALEDGILVAWLAAKCYLDADRKTACITWAYSEPRSTANDAIMAAVEQWARDRKCLGIYCARRRTRLKAFIRRMRHYGYAFEGIICVKELKDVVPDVKKVAV